MHCKSKNHPQSFQEIEERSFRRVSKKMNNVYRLSLRYMGVVFHLSMFLLTLLLIQSCGVKSTPELVEVEVKVKKLEQDRIMSK